jgi:hypothetical protein
LDWKSGIYANIKIKLEEDIKLPTNSSKLLKAMLFGEDM